MTAPFVVHHVERISFLSLSNAFFLSLSFSLCLFQTYHQAVAPALCVNLSREKCPHTHILSQRLGHASIYREREKEKDVKLSIAHEEIRHVKPWHKTWWWSTTQLEREIDIVNRVKNETKRTEWNQREREKEKTKRWNAERNESRKENIIKRHTFPFRWTLDKNVENIIRWRIGHRARSPPRWVAHSNQAIIQSNETRHEKYRRKNTWFVSHTRNSRSELRTLSTHSYHAVTYVRGMEWHASRFDYFPAMTASMARHDIDEAGKRAIDIHRREREREEKYIRTEDDYTVHVECACANNR